MSKVKGVRDLTIEELKDLIEQIIEKKLKALFLDPDYGLELKEEVEQRLKASLTSKDRIPLDEVKREFGIDRNIRSNLHSMP